MQSIWKEANRSRKFGRVEKDLETDVLIIGGGLCGVLCAYYLQQAGADCVLVEADRIGSGITGHTTAKITTQHGLMYYKLLAQFGAEKTKQYFDANEAARMQYDFLCRQIDCDYEVKDAYVYALDGNEALVKEAAALRQLGLPGQMVESLPLPFPVSGAIRFKDQAQFHPLKFLDAICESLPIYEYSPVTAIHGTNASVNGCTIRTPKTVVATHFPILNRHGLYPLKLYQHRSYVLALKNVPLPDGMYVDAAQTGMSFRSYGDLLLLGGGGHRTGKPGGNWGELRRFAQLHYPGAVEVRHWAAQDCMSLDGVPYIGPYSASTENLYVATGFQKWGMTSSMVAAMLLTDLIRGKDVPYGAVFSPSRSMLRPQLAANAWESVTNLLTPSVKRCPHLGCALKWNAAEHSWDCPCHGSRFAENGNLLDNPANCSCRFFRNNPGGPESGCKNGKKRV